MECEIHTPRWNEFNDTVGEEQDSHSKAMLPWLRILQRAIGRIMRYSLILNNKKTTCKLLTLVDKHDQFGKYIEQWAVIRASWNY